MCVVQKLKIEREKERMQRTITRTVVRDTNRHIRIVQNRETNTSSLCFIYMYKYIIIVFK